MFLAVDEMNEALTSYLIKKLKTEKYGKESVQKVTYSIHVILNEIEKLFVLLILFSLAHKAIEFLLAYICLVSLRIFTGGNHCKTSTGCLLYTGFIYGCIIFAVSCIQVTDCIKATIEFLSIVCIWTNDKTLSEGRIRYSDLYVMKFRLNGMTVLCIEIILTSILSSRYAAVIVCSMGMNVIDVFLFNLRRRRVDKNG